MAVCENALDAVAGDLAWTTPTLSANQTLEQALALLVRHEHPGLPVLAADGGHVIGWLTHRDVLHAYNERLEQSVDQAQRARTEPTLGTLPAPDSSHVEHKGAQACALDGGPDQEVHPLLARLRGYRIVDLEITRDQPPARQRVMDVTWPPSSLVIAVRRNGETFTPNGQTELRKGDRLTVLAPAEHAETLADVVHAEQRS